MRLLLVLLALVLLFLVLLWVFQRRLVYLPLDRDVPPAERVLPGAEEVRLDTTDGLQLGAWYLAPRAAWGAVLVFNGNAGHRGYRAPLAEALARAGLAVLLLDYRGYGENPGSPSEAGLRLDADAAVRFLRERGWPAERLAYFGESLGAAVAVDLAGRLPPGALVLRSPFASLAEIARVHYPFLPVRLLLRDRYASIDRIRDLHAPVLVIAGERDSIVPLGSSRALFAAAGEPKRWVAIPGADHNDLELLAGRKMLTEIVEFLRSYLDTA